MPQELLGRSKARVNHVGDVEHNASPVRFGNTMGELERVVTGFVGGIFTESNAKVIANRRELTPPRKHGAHIGTVHGTEAGETENKR